MFSLILNIVALSLALFSLYLMLRNSWVYRRRIELNRFENGVHVIDSYVDYDTMLRKFWIWDVEKFKLHNVEVSRSEAVGLDRQKLDETIKMSAAHALSLIQETQAAERERIAKHFDARNTGQDGKPLGIGFYDPHEPAEIIRAL
jgi:hypothetical protein